LSRCSRSRPTFFVQALPEYEGKYVKAGDSAGAILEAQVLLSKMVYISIDVSDRLSVPARRKAVHVVEGVLKDEQEVMDKSMRADNSGSPF